VAAVSSPLAGLTEDQLRQVLNVGATFAALQVAADVLEKTAFDDDDVEAINWLPVAMRTHTVARLIDAAEAIREELREVDGRILMLTGDQGTTGP
jgi:hypothetical protein